MEPEPPGDKIGVPMHGAKRQSQTFSSDCHTFYLFLYLQNIYGYTSTSKTKLTCRSFDLTLYKGTGKDFFINRIRIRPLKWNPLQPGKNDPDKTHILKTMFVELSLMYKLLNYKNIYPEYNRIYITRLGSKSNI